MYIENSTFLLRNLQMFDKYGKCLLKNKRDFKGKTQRVEIDLAEGERIIGVRANLTHEYQGRKGYWKWFEFLISGKDNLH